MQSGCQKKIEAKHIRLGFLSIRRYRDIDRGCGNPAIIVALRYRTIS